MAHSTREIERKYVFPGETAEGGPPALPDLTGAPGVTAAVPEGVMELDAVYHDTEDLRLAAADITLRRREGGRDAGWHVKFPISPGVRDEIRSPLSEKLPADLAGLLRSRLRGAVPVPVIRLVSSRDVTVLVGADGAPLVEVSVDSVRAERLEGRAGDGPAEVSWIEVEAELQEGGDLAVLDAVDARLREAGLTPAPSASKLARALTETGAALPPARPPATPVTAGDHVLAHLREQAEALVTLDPAVRRGVPDSVHRMRIAARRLRAGLRSYRQVLDRRVTGPIEVELRWLGAELGLDRDNEVLTEHLAARIAAVPRPLLLGPVEARLRIWSTVNSTRARETTLAALDSDRYLALLASLRDLLAHPPLRKHAEGDPARVLPKALLKEYGRLAGRVEHALRLAPGDERDLAVHSARKSAKRVRYAAEAARPALGQPAKRFGGQIKEIQQLLGEHQDSVVVRATVRELAVQAHAAGESAFTWGLLYAAERERALRCEKALPDLWARVSRRGRRSVLTD